MYFALLIGFWGFQSTALLYSVSNTKLKLRQIFHLRLDNFKCFYLGYVCCCSCFNLQ